MKIRHEKRRVLTNFVLFQLGWFACVGSAAIGLSWVGVSIASAIFVFHLLSATNPAGELKLAGFALLLGATFDSLVLASGWLQYPSGIVLTGLAPVWILALWVLFSTTLNLSMRWLQGRPLLTSVLGFVFGPLSYIAGERMGAVQFLQPTPVLLALATGWALAMPLLLAMARRCEGAGLKHLASVVKTAGSRL